MSEDASFSEPVIGNLQHFAGFVVAFLSRIGGSREKKLQRLYFEEKVPETETIEPNSEEVEELSGTKTEFLKIDGDSSNRQLLVTQVSIS